MRSLISSFSIIFLHFPPHMQHVTFHLTFLLISFIFINKCAKNSILPFQSLFHFLSQNTHLVMPTRISLPNIQLGIPVPYLWYYFFFSKFYYMKFSLGMLQKPPPWGTTSSVLNHTKTSAKLLKRRHTSHGYL